MPYMAQFVMQGASGLPEDRYVNTFNFIEDAPAVVSHEDAAVGIDIALGNFYTLTQSTGFAMEAFLARHVAGVAEVRVYNFDDPQPREPIILTRNIDPPATARAMPSEVAVCLSYYSFLNVPRQRGRIYFGPINGDAVESVPTVPHPTANFLNTLAEAGTDLAVSGAAAGQLRWAVLSRATPGVVEWGPITDGWVDNAFDTQRRRGEKATARTTWTVGS